MTEKTSENYTSHKCPECSADMTYLDFEYFETLDGSSGKSHGFECPECDEYLEVEEITFDNNPEGLTLGELAEKRKAQNNG